MKPLPYLLALILFTITACSEKTPICGEIGEIPQHFSPDGDGREEAWVIDIKHMDSWEVTIYNRWGQVQYEAVDEPVNWDGKLPDGEEAIVGTYVYQVKCRNDCGDEFEKQGMVTLLR